MNSSAHVFCPFFVFLVFFVCLVFFGGGGVWGGGGLKLWSFCRQCYSEAIGRIDLKFCMSNFSRLIIENLPSGFGIDPIRNANSKFFRLPFYYQENMHFRCLRSNYTKIMVHIFTKFGTMVHHTIGRLKKNLAFVTSKMRIQECFFHILTADAYANVPNCDALICTLFGPSGVFIYFF